MKTSDPIPCRWKRLRGTGREAIYRATCGRAGCPGHLGDLSYLDGRSADLHQEFRALVKMSARLGREVVRLRQEADQLRNSARFSMSPGDEAGASAGTIPPETADRSVIERIVQEVRASLPPARTWLMSAAPIEHASSGPSRRGGAVYRGFAEAGFRISHTGRRALNGNRIGRRPLRLLGNPLNPLPQDSAAREALQMRDVDGQIVQPTDRVWCPVCGALNQLNWPEPLQDFSAR